MGLTVSSVIHLPYMKDVQVVAGREGLGRPIEGVSILEPAGIQAEGAGLKNMMVVTNEAFFQVYGQQSMQRVVAMYAQNQVAALCFKISTTANTLLPEDLMQAAERFRLPLLCLPADTSIAAVINGVTYEVLRGNGYNMMVPYEENLIQELIFAERDKQMRIKRAAMLGIKVDELLGLILIQPEGRIDSQKIVAFCKKEWDTNCLCSSRNGRALVLLRMSTPYETMHQRLVEKTEQLLQALTKRFRSAGFTLGIGHCYEHVHEVYRSYYEARMALVAGQTVQSGERIFLFDNMGVYRILFDLKNRDALYQFRDETVGRLQRYDEKRSTSFLETVKVFMAQSYSVQGTAAALFVHYNTIRYRMNKIKAVFGWDLTDSNDCMNLFLGLKIDEYLRRDQDF